MKKTVSGAKRVIILRGLQGSGKSTYAKQLVDTSMYKRINYDSLRWYDSEGNSKMYVFSPKAEQDIKTAATTIASMHLLAGYSLVIDNTNLKADELNYWVRFAEQNGAIPEIVDINTDLDVCIAQNDLREGWQKVPRPVIERAALKSGRIIWPTAPLAIFDIDGVLFDNSHRMHHLDTERQCERCKNTGKCHDNDCSCAKYPVKDRLDCIYCDGPKQHKKNWAAFFSEVSKDKPIIHTIQWVKMLKNSGYHIVLLTGRPADRTGDATIEQLKQNDVPYDRLFMRGHNEFDQAADFKEKIVNLIQRHKLIEFAVDDQPSVIEMYNRRGIKAYNVGTGEYF
jgi:predicted kinase